MKAEILAPAGDETSARAALLCGADAVYLGLTRFSARESAENFDLSSLRRTADFAHILGAKIYVCLNTLVKNEELGAFFSSAREAWNAGADAILMQDLFLGKALKERYPEIVLHLSTQAGCCNVRGAQFAKECGFSRVVLARENPLSGIEKITKVIETEVFVQGALCSCFSGQCYLSSFAGNNSGNRGRCKQPCRKKYSLDRAGYEEYAYALSPSDLSVGERIKELLDAGVVSLKIEGRMRRPEYVAAAVRYYRALLEGRDASGELSDLKRAYNRGDYTHGLAFGQGKDFLSRKVQGHIGERVGQISANGFCKSTYAARKGDGFKILRGGYEVGGAVFAKSGKDGFFLASSEKLMAGDEVRLTTEAALSERLSSDKKRKIVLELTFLSGRPAEVRCEGFRFSGDPPEEAKSAPLTREEVETCFCKTDGLPFAVCFGEVTLGNVFLPKSALNALRRRFYEAFVRSISCRTPLAERSAIESGFSTVPSESRALICTEPRNFSADILIYKPRDYTKLAEKKGSAVFLYLPAFFTDEDEESVRGKLSSYDGIYCDGFYGLSLAKEYGLPFFAGTGFNLTNRISVESVREGGAKYFALSKELSCAEQEALSAEGAFALRGGAVKVMDLGYCPFEKNCTSCDRREFYRLKDEDGREFPLRRYCTAGGCRFEVYNCAPLAVRKNSFGVLEDRTAEQDLPPTKGHYERSML